MESLYISECLLYSIENTYIWTEKKFQVKLAQKSDGSDLWHDVNNIKHLNVELKKDGNLRREISDIQNLVLEPSE